MGILELNGVRVLELDVDGSLIATEMDAAEIIGSCFGTKVEMIAIPIARLAPDFFDLSNGMLGGVMQKFATYRFRVAFIGDISAEIEKSNALRDYVLETNSQRQVLFAKDTDELKALMS